MALLTTCTSANKVPLRGESVVELRTYLADFWYYDTDLEENTRGAWWVETITRESFEYVGLTEAAAASCAATLIAEYTVSRNIPTIVDGEISYSAQDVQIAEVTPVPMSANMWKITVDINDRVLEIRPLNWTPPEE